MEGTRHEKVVIVLAAYVIGFTTAFIAFGITKMNTETKVVYMHEQKQTTITEETDNQAMLASVGFGEDGLYSITQQKERILAADRNEIAKLVELGAAEPGFYYKIIDAEASRDGRFVYYCEQLTEEAANCDPYVYALETDTLYHVKLDGQSLYPIVETHESMWTGESTLMVNGGVSMDENEPWKLRTVDDLQVQ